MVEEHSLLIANRLATFREYIGLSQQEVAEQVGTTKETICLLEKDLSSTLYMLLHVCSYYNRNYKLDLAWVFNGGTTDTKLAITLTNSNRPLR
jgi:DNA-binding XRE family transcriptional regulator